MYFTLEYIDDYPQLTPHDTLAEAEEYALEASLDGNCHILSLIRTVWACDADNQDLAASLGLIPARDYPATLFR
ncbi:hypothetical protein LJC59_04285 [Desulfovibrio sp. OttesenSCG-928-A18]|nr:hypothetical protein [Desulfovibrio sp. OttesenSCG-928-A18]